MNPGDGYPLEMRVAVIGKTLSGGAGRAMVRITDALVDEGSSQQVQAKYFLSPAEEGLPLKNGVDSECWNRSIRVAFRMQVFANRLTTRNLFWSPERSLVSYPRVNSGIARKLLEQNFDLAHLHWLGDSTMSIREVGRLHVPIVWTLHDMWPIGGAQHYSLTKRHRAGYNRSNREERELGADLNLMAWNKKIQSWEKPMVFVSPSEWLAREAKSTLIGSRGQVFHIPNPIDTTYWTPDAKTCFREAHNVGNADKVIVFGSAGGKKNPLKGSETLLPLLRGLAERFRQLRESPNIKVFVFGDSGENQFFGNIHLSFLGNLDDEQLRAMYSAADLAFVPSLIDNFPSVATEAISCGTPIVTFENYGPAEIVRKTGAGLISGRNDIDQTVSDVIALLKNSSALKKMSEAGRKFAQSEWNPARIRDQYLCVYQEASALARGDISY